MRKNTKNKVVLIAMIHFSKKSLIFGRINK